MTTTDNDREKKMLAAFAKSEIERHVAAIEIDKVDIFEQRRSVTDVPGHLRTEIDLSGTSTDGSKYQLHLVVTKPQSENSDG